MLDIFVLTLRCVHCSSNW